MSLEDDHWIDDWKEHADRLTKLFQQKLYNETKPIMIEQSDLFLKRLYHLNGKKWDEEIPLEEIDLLINKPINCFERMNYVKTNLTQYHAFIQLNALYNELAKLFAKLAILERRKQSIDK
ncbi:hypothetical protein KQI76_03445 [Amphibacillus sp. MSJ-3]|uniref:YpoC family protein n=1 Tax=Amphibacillus sp. MSJ-3 TaxID=2841505 RepID=UPI001C0E9664|nr:hypothetical protein [Amphibacillus sp. MSJ-3]MBU5594208.1 hypothetical protein [Amphibacillus sp. MSJ-3]